MVDEEYSPGINHSYGYEFIIGYDNRSETTSYLVRYTPVYDSGIIRAKVNLSACIRRSYSDSYFGVGSAGSKVHKYLNMGTPEKRVVV